MLLYQHDKKLSYNVRMIFDDIETCDDIATYVEIATSPDVVYQHMKLDHQDDLSSFDDVGLYKP